MKTNDRPAEKQMEKDGRRYREVVKKSALPIWGAAAVWLFAALLLPMHRLGCIIAVAAVSLFVGLLMAKTLPKETEWEEIPFSSGSTDLDCVVRETGKMLALLKAAEDDVAVNEPDTARCLASIGGTVTKIRDALIAEPRDLPVVRRFMNYYLPTTEKLVNKYVFVLKQDTDSKNITETKTSIEAALSQIDTAYKNQLDALFADDALDISTDITVLEAMLTRDNLQ